MITLGTLKFALASALLLSVGVQPAGAVNFSKSKCTIVGTVGNDNLIGTSGKDVICGLGGDDLIEAGTGNDVIFGGAGNDKISGGDGNDKIYGEAGNDSLVGGNQADVIDGGFGKDQLFGGNGNDTLNGLGQDDFIFGEAGNDKITGGAGNDMISGGFGRDNIWTNQGFDTCSWDASDSLKDSCKLDTTAPVITPIGATSLRFEAGTTAVFRWNSTDSSGVEESWLSIGGASGWVTKWCDFIVKSELIGGSSKNGTFETKCDIPKTAPNLTYSVFVSSRDYMGNISSSTEAITFEVFGGSSDTNPPTFEYLSGPTSVSAGQSFDITWRSTDLTDVAVTFVYFALEDYAFSDGVISYFSSVSNPERISGDDTDAVYKMTVQVNRDSPAGQYTLWVITADSLGNKRFDKTENLIQVTR
jgi:Ca2+-binding RTX toxin-like protein